MKDKKDTLDYITEVADTKTDAEKQQLLQKYGIIEPKLTESEKELCTVINAKN